MSLLKNAKSIFWENNKFNISACSPSWKVSCKSVTVFLKLPISFAILYWFITGIYPIDNLGNEEVNLLDVYKRQGLEKEIMMIAHLEIGL